MRPVCDLPGWVRRLRWYDRAAPDDGDLAMRKGLATLTVVAVFAIASCGGSDSELTTTEPTSPAESSTTASVTPTTTASDSGNASSSSSSIATEPDDDGDGALEWEYGPFGEISGQMQAVASSGDLIVAVGGHRNRASAWVSDDGLQWALAANIFDSDVFGLEDKAEGQQGFLARMTSVTVGGPGFVAVGSAQSTDGELGDNGFVSQSPSFGAVWLSVDGATWEVVGPDPAVFGARTGVPQQVWDVVGPSSQSGQGMPLVAVGVEGGVQDETVAIVWVSDDGREWESLPAEAVEGNSEGSQMISVARADYGFVAAGIAVSEGVPFPATWFSSDGTQWTVIPLPDDSSSAFLEVTGWGPSFYAAVAAGDRVWRSRDGQTWEVAYELPEDPPSGFHIRTIAAGQFGVAAGSCGIVTTSDGTNWTYWPETGACEAGPLASSGFGNSITWANDRIVAVSAANALDYIASSFSLVGRRGP